MSAIYCIICKEWKSTDGCLCDRIKAKKEALEIYHNVMNDNGMNNRIYGEFKPSVVKCNFNGYEKSVKDEKEYLRHLKYYHGVDT